KKFGRLLAACFEPGCKAREPRALYERAAVPGKRKDLACGAADFRGSGVTFVCRGAKSPVGGEGRCDADAAFQRLQKVYLLQSGRILRNHDFRESTRGGSGMAETLGGFVHDCPELGGIAK